MKSLLISSFLFFSVCVSIFGQQGAPAKIIPNHFLKIGFCSDSTSYVNFNNCSNLEIINDPTKQFEIVSFYLEIVWKNKVSSYVEFVSGSRITNISKVQMRKMVIGDKLVITQVVVRDKKGKEFEIAPITVTIIETPGKPSNVKPASKNKDWF